MFLNPREIDSKKLTVYGIRGGGYYVSRAAAFNI